MNGSAVALVVNPTAPSIDAALEYGVSCHHGGRSAMAAQWLRSQGFARVANLEGGIDAWSLEVDASVPRD